MTKAVTREEIMRLAAAHREACIQFGYAEPGSGDEDICGEKIKTAQEALEVAIATIIRERDEAVDLARISDGTTKTMIDGAQKLSDEISKLIVERDALQIDNKKLRMSDKDDMVAPCGCTEHFVAAGDASHFKPMDTSCKYPEVLADRDLWKKRAEEAVAVLKEINAVFYEDNPQGKSRLFNAIVTARGIVTRLSSEG